MSRVLDIAVLEDSSYCTENTPQAGVSCLEKA